MMQIKDKFMKLTISKRLFNSVMRFCLILYIDRLIY